LLLLKRLTVISIILLFSSIWLQGRSVLTDSTKVKSTFIITPRFNSTGHFPFTGSLINHNINADINIFFERKALGFFLFKSHDLQESHSIVNYFQPGVFATAQLNPSLKARVFFGYLFSQANSFRDGDSDYYTALSLYLNLAKGLRIENTSLFYDLNQQIKLADRLLLSWQTKKVKVDLYVWERVVLGEQNHATSAMLAITFPTIKVSESVTIVFSSSYQRYLTNNRPSFALKDGFLFSLSMPFSLSP
jgi:hypothetical protein